MSHNLREELRDIINTQGGATVEQAVNFLWTLRMIRYSTDQQIVRLPFPKVRGKRKDLVRLGYLSLNDGVYTATEKSIELFKQEGRKIPLLNPPLDGYGGLESLRKTDVLIDALKLPSFKAFLFPRFDYLIPDALIVQAESERRYKLTFLEVEYEKADWDNHLEKKRIGYERLGKDQTVYRYWLKQAELLGLEKPTEEQFCFSICCIGNIKKDWEAWTFNERLET